MSVVDVALKLRESCLAYVVANALPVAKGDASDTCSPPFIGRSVHS